MLNVLTVNVRFDNEKDGEFRWTARREAMRSVIETNEPDIIATQEGRRPQIMDLHSLLPDFELADVHRQWIEHRMYPCIFVRSAVLEIVDSGDIWLSDTPDVEESQLEESNYPRLLSWALVRNRRDSQKIVVGNVHLDNAGTNVRRRQLEIAGEHLVPITSGLPLVLCGDFNDGPSSDVAAAAGSVLPDLYDPWTACCKVEQSTYRGFGGPGSHIPAPDFIAPRIDWILLDRQLTFERIDRVEDTPRGMPPTDHFPVVCKGVRSRAQIISRLSEARPTVWRNPKRLPVTHALSRQTISVEQLDEAYDTLQRLSPTVSAMFGTDMVSASADFGVGRSRSPFHSPLREIRSQDDGRRVFAKCDNLLPYAGSIKARGGFYEVLLHAGRIAGSLDTETLLSTSAQTEFAKRTISVASTGNLGLSVGLAARALGFRVQVYMSRDAKAWKKQLLRSRGAEIVECSGDYSAAVPLARDSADATSVSSPETAAAAHTYFVDDERSLHLFLGYSGAARELLAQLKDAGIPDCPVAVYLPCGVGGGPGGVTYGLKHYGGDRIRSFFVEPVAAPCFLYGMLQGSDQGHDGDPELGHIRELGLDGRTQADGLAVGVASPLVVPIMRTLLDGVITCNDEEILGATRCLRSEHDLRVEPSAAAAYAGFRRLNDDADIHVLWLTGGGLWPQSEYERIKA